PRRGRVGHLEVGNRAVDVGDARPALFFLVPVGHDAGSPAARRCSRTLAISLLLGLMTSRPWSPSTRAMSPSDAHRKRPLTSAMAGMFSSLSKARVRGPEARSVR